MKYLVRPLETPEACCAAAVKTAQDVVRNIV